MIYSALKRNFSSESPICASAAHAAEIVQGAVPLGVTPISWGITKPLRGTICVKNNSLYSTLGAVIPATHVLKFLFAPIYYNYKISRQLYFSEELMSKDCYFLDLLFLLSAEYIMIIIPYTNQWHPHPQSCSLWPIFSSFTSR